MLSAPPTLFTAGKIMTTDVVSVGPDTSIEEVADLLEEYRVSGLAVVDDQQRLLGVVTEYDLLQGIASLRMRGKAIDFMTSEVAAVDEDACLPELARIFASTRVRRLPVTSAGKLIGVISRRDLIFAGRIRQHLLMDLPTCSDVPPGENPVCQFNSS